MTTILIFIAFIICIQLLYSSPSVTTFLTHGHLKIIKKESDHAYHTRCFELWVQTSDNAKNITKRRKTPE